MRLLDSCDGPEGDGFGVIQIPDHQSGGAPTGEADTWEARMAQRARASRAVAEAADRAEENRLRHREYDRWASTEPLPGEERIPLDTIETEHAGHLSHWCEQQGIVACSCGCGGWVVTYIPVRPAPPCEVCRARQIGAFQPPARAFNALEIVAGVLVQPIRDAFHRHLDDHGCGDPWHPNYTGGFGHCEEAMSLYRLLPERERIIRA